MDAISEARLTAACPVLIDRMRQLDVSLQSQNVNLRLTNVYRSMAQQAADYDQGRTAPGKIITHARPGQSWHQFSMAVDCVPMVDGEPDWNIEGPNWQKVFAMLPGIGLFSGKNFKDLTDNDHIQLAEIPESPTAEDIALLTTEGMQAVWLKYYPQQLS